MCDYASLIGAIDRIPRCGKIFLKHSIDLFLRMVSLVTPEQGVNAVSKANFAAFLGIIPSYFYASVVSKSLITTISDWQTISFKSLATVVVISNTLALAPKLRALILPALFVESTDVVWPSSAPISFYTRSENFATGSRHSAIVSCSAC